MPGLRPWLWVPALLAHDIGVCALRVSAPFIPKAQLEWLPFQWRGLTFKNRLGISGGVDKNGTLTVAFEKLGSAFVEVGTVTPKPQGPNPGTIMQRDVATQAIWNKMGFPNDGAEKIIERLRHHKQSLTTPIFFNVGKNRDTSLENAHLDYLSVMNSARDVCDVFVVNISSPNTQSLRDLLKPENLKKFLDPLIAAKKDKPLLLKLSPDADRESLLQTIETSLAAGVDGWILTNTTLHRDPNSPFPAEGGVSGRPLAETSKYVLNTVVQHLGTRRGDRLIVSAGGIMNSEDVMERLKLGADLVSVYSALVFNGPLFFKSVARDVHKHKGSVT